MLKFILLILDGYGLRTERENNAAKLAVTPVLDDLLKNNPMVSLQTSGKAVGLPDGVMGNSEVGHMNIGAGRIVRQDLVRINDSLQDDSLRNNPNLVSLFQYVQQQNSTLHLMGLFSDGGVHSHIDHLTYLVTAARDYGLKDIAIHAFTDGRDTPPDSGIRYMSEFLKTLNSLGAGRIASVCGRFYAMDRDNRWDRVQKAYSMLRDGVGAPFTDPVAAIRDAYEQGETDEFIKPRIISPGAVVKPGDGLLAFNYRADRMREISRTFTEKDFDTFPVKPVAIKYVSMTQYQENFSFPVLFPPEQLTHIFPEVLSEAGYRQLRIAETEKYAHVTYFFNGGDERKFPGEDRLLIPSPKVATYDLQPEMNADKVTDEVLRKIAEDRYEAIILNFANPDMVGHTGILPAAIRAIETVDKNVGRILKLITEKQAALFLTADHGNLELMTDPQTGKPHTAHTTLPVPFVMKLPTAGYNLTGPGKLADIAPTILDYLGLAIPGEMNGNSLLCRD